MLKKLVVLNVEVNGNSILNFKRKYLIASNITNSNGKILFSRDLDYGFAITSHRAQGSTYKKCICRY